MNDAGWFGWIVRTITQKDHKEAINQEVKKREELERRVDGLSAEMTAAVDKLSGGKNGHYRRKN